MKKVMRLDFSPVDNINHTLYKDVKKIVVNGGGLGGSREEILCKIISLRDDNDFMIVQSIMTDEIIMINPLYIGTIKTKNMTKVDFTHHNGNFPSGKRTYWFTHRVGTEIELRKDDNRNQYPSMDIGKQDTELNLKLVSTDDYVRC